jgi:acetolactate synthase-1/2/3 large subunit
MSPYHFTHELSKLLPEGAVVVTGNGTVSLGMFQSAIIKAGQRVIMNSGCASMGYDVPAAIGAACTSDGDVVCLAGDGSFQMNIQELATIAYNRLPIKIFYYDNGGYASIRQTQDNFFGRRYGIDENSGLMFPDTSKIAEAYGIPHRSIRDPNAVTEDISAVLAIPGPVLCHVYLDPTHIFEPKLSSERKPDGRLVSKPLEDMFPFLPRKEFRENMIIEPAKED